MRSQTLRLIAWIAATLPGLGAAPAFAAACGTGARQRVQGAGLDYQRVPFEASTIDPADLRYAWTNEWGSVRLVRGSLLTSTDPALYQIIRFVPIYSMALTRSGQYLQFDPAWYSDRAIDDVRVAVAPELINRRPIGSMLIRPRPGEGPSIAGYRFQMAERLFGSNDSLGLWRRIRGSGARTLLVLFSRRTGRPNEYTSRIVGRSDLAFSLLSQTESAHGGIWAFTLFTEAPCPNAIAMLSYRWVLHMPGTGRR
jgi:hypothetical protein